MRHEKNTRKDINIDQVCDHLNWLFKNVTKNVPKPAVAGTKLHQYQVEFSYYLNEIQRGATYIVPKIIAECNEFLDNIAQTHQQQ